jgi:DNA-binding CsgD family transcriptional regulator
MDDHRLDELAADIQAHGLLDAICLHPDGRILDGRNRYRACERVGVEPRTQAWDGNGSPIDFVVSRNLHRRHLTKAQRVLAAGRIANLPAGTNQFREGVSGETPSPTRQQAAAQLDVSVSAVGRGRAILANGVPELVAAVESGTITISAANDLATLPPAEQHAVLKQDRKQIAHRAEAIRNGVSATALARERRRERICAMARDGHSSEQIAAAVKVGVETVRKTLKNAGVAAVADRIVGHARKHDPNRIINAMALDAENVTADAKLIDFRRLDHSRVEAWLVSFRTARRALDCFIHRLEKELPHGED